jgi:hypothetical protein
VGPPARRHSTRAPPDAQRRRHGQEQPRVLLPRGARALRSATRPPARRARLARAHALGRRSLPRAQVKGQRRELLTAYEQKLDGADVNEAKRQAALSLAAAQPPVPVVRARSAADASAPQRARVRAASRAHTAA